VFPFENDAMLVEDREDLIALLRMRFGSIPPKVIEAIYEIDRMDTLERLILVAASVPDFEIFLDELKAPSQSFRMIGGRFNPIGNPLAKGEANGKEGQ
jgi:hypothetical protein